MPLIDEEKGEAGIVERNLELTSVNLSEETAQDEPQSPTDQTIKSTRTSSTTTLLDRSRSRLRSSFSSLRRLITRDAKETASGGGCDDDISDSEYEYNVRRLDDAPNGYPRMATFLDSDENFMLYRRFGYLQSRLLLEKQDDLRRLEAQLGLLDGDDEGKTDVLKTREYYDDECMKERKSLVEQIEKKWLEYSKLLLTASQMTALTKPTDTEHKSVKWWMEEQQLLVGADARFILEKEDLITLRPGREYAVLDAGVEMLLRKLSIRPLANLFRARETRIKMEGCSDSINYYTRHRISALVNAIMLVVVLVLLIVPVYVLFHVTEGGADTPGMEGTCIGVLVVSTLIFSAGVRLFSRAKRHEVFAASAAYCAVLVVFIGNIGGRGLSSAFKTPA